MSQDFVTALCRDAHKNAEAYAAANGAQKMLAAYEIVKRHSNDPGFPTCGVPNLVQILRHCLPDLGEQEAVFNNLTFLIDGDLAISSQIKKVWREAATERRIENFCEIIESAIGGAVFYSATQAMPRPIEVGPGKRTKLGNLARKVAAMLHIPGL